MEKFIMEELVFELVWENWLHTYKEKWEVFPEEETA